MKRIRKHLTALLLSCFLAFSGVAGSYQTAQAAEFSAGALAASETLEWLSAVFASAGIAVSVKELLKPRRADIEKDIGKDIDWDNYDWGDMLDSPAAQDQIDELDKTINKLYGNASAKWKEMYEKSLSPTPTPETSPDNPEPSPPVTVAPVDPDTVTPPDWETLKNMSKHNGFIPLEVGTFWCLKEAVKGLWDDWMDNTLPTTKLNGNPLAVNSKDLVGRVDIIEQCGSPNTGTWTTHYYFYATRKYDDLAFYVSGNKENNMQFWDVRTSSYSNGTVRPPWQSDNRYVSCYTYYTGPNGSSDSFDTASRSFNTDVSSDAGIKSVSYNLQFYVPYSLGGTYHSADTKPVDKNALWVNPDLKSDYDNNKSPSLPDTAPAPAIKIPSLDDLKDLQKKGNDASDDDRPSIILDWLKDHYMNPSTDPQPTTAPDPDPNPTTAPNPDPDPDPDPKPDPTTTPAVNPEPSTVPKPSGTPENPDDTDTDTDIDPDDYKADLRLVFPFCIPFDLIHLLNVLDAEPEAPRFEIPIDLEADNPFTDKKIVDYHTTIVIDMSDYEQPIKVIRIFEVMFFILGLLLITRQQMIKG